MTAPTMAHHAVTNADLATYRVLVSWPNGALLSESAALTLTRAPDAIAFNLPDRPLAKA